MGGWADGGLVKIAIVGFGKMGRAIRDLAIAQGHEIVAEIDLGQLSEQALRGAQVAIEFTQPDAAADNLIRLAGWKIPVVCGTTGWYARLPEVKRAVEGAGSALVHAPNFSIGVQILLRVAREVGRALAAQPAFDAQVIDIHHRAKKDAPSGTAGALREALRSVDATREYPITSVRVGQVPGTHEVLVEGPGESLSFRHEARDRSIFAQGALTAAHWLVERPRRGVFTLDQVLFGEGK
jgi:4-hydroxy-tetrahydrodipicolinate reductase